MMPVTLKSAGLCLYSHFPLPPPPPFSFPTCPCLSGTFQCLPSKVVFNTACILTLFSPHHFKASILPGMWLQTMEREKSQWRSVCDVCYLFEAAIFLGVFWYLGISSQLSPFWCVFAWITKKTFIMMLNWWLQNGFLGNLNMCLTS